MDGSPRVTDVSFTPAKRGYDPDEVDAYLEQLDGVVFELRRSWRGALDRADALEAQLAQASAEAEASSQETLARTLLLAQKAADEAIAEAKAQARRIVEEATTDVGRLMAEAESARDDARREAAAEIETVLDEARGRIDAEVAELAAQRDVLRHDVDLLEQHLAVQRANLRGAIGKLQQLVDLPETFRLEDRPELESLDPPMAEPTAPAEPAPARTMVRRPSASATVHALPTRAEAEEAPAEEPVAATSPEEPTEAAVEVEAAPEVEAEVVAEAPAEEPVAEAPVAEEPAASAMPKRTPPLAPPASTDRVELDEVVPAPAEESVATVADLSARRATQAAEPVVDDELDEEFLNELQRAVNDDGGLPAPLDQAEDEAMRAFFESDLDEPRRSRFGRRS